MSDDVTVWFNPRCSKCRQTRDLLGEAGISCSLYEYLDERPTRAEIEEVLALLGADDPRAMMRTGEDVYRDLGLSGADRDRLLDAMAEHPILIERPIVISGGRAVIARPPEKFRELLG